ncbi:hypothetical protein [Sinorhizobium americanum]|uniref:Arc-like DNA binding dprotein n=1 Tax=Sinorhizobium americanum TaxID=194963 RepID=A0A4R2BRF7_9HYPH|nr:hypothetical protein [Sinorhizobium americanum]TCN30307.1 hypothetical protein EV184_108181 [Sinorhizobium americanum]
MSDMVRLNIRLPADVAAYLDETSKTNLTSRNAEVVRAVRERMQSERVRLQAEWSPPPADQHPHQGSVEGKK